MEIKMIQLGRQVKLQPFTPTEKEWSILSFLANELGIKLEVCPDTGYRYAPAITFNGIKGYVQKHISAWQTKIEYDHDNVRIHKGTKCQLQNGIFVLPDGNTFRCPRESTKEFLKPLYELFAIIGDRKISLSQIEKELEHHPELKDLINQTFFNKSFYDKTNNGK